MKCSVNAGWFDRSIYEIDWDSSMVFYNYDFGSRTIEAPVLATLSRGDNYPDTWGQSLVLD